MHREDALQRIFHIWSSATKSRDRSHSVRILAALGWSAPIIVDKSGRAYGYLSANRYHHNRTRIEVLVQLADLVAEQYDLDKARDLFCGD